MPQMTKVHARRLERLADKLDTVPRKQFDISEWFVKNALGEGKKTDCGTVACALGWACSIPSFKKAGLKIRMYQGLFAASDDSHGDITFTPQLPADLSYCDATVAEKKAVDRFYCPPGVYEGFSAGAAFFGLDEETASDLFSVCGYRERTGLDVTPKMVAKKIRHLLKKFRQNVLGKKL